MTNQQYALNFLCHLYITKQPQTKNYRVLHAAGRSFHLKLIRVIKKLERLIVTILHLDRHVRDVVGVFDGLA